jgi:hypothetical protein
MVNNTTKMMVKSTNNQNIQQTAQQIKQQKAGYHQMVEQDSYHRSNASHWH